MNLKRCNCTGGCGRVITSSERDEVFTCTTCKERNGGHVESVKYSFKKRAPFYFDVDDTILTDNGNGPPYENAKEVIEGLIKIGNEVNIWSARGKDWAKHVAENILKIKGCNAYLTKPHSSKTFDDNPERIAKRLIGVKPLLSNEDWYSLGMKYLRWSKR